MLCACPSHPPHSRQQRWHEHHTGQPAPCRPPNPPSQAKGHAPPADLARRKPSGSQTTLRAASITFPIRAPRPDLSGPQRFSRGPSSRRSARVTSQPDFATSGDRLRPGRNHRRKQEPEAVFWALSAITTAFTRNVTVGIGARLVRGNAPAMAQDRWLLVPAPGVSRSMCSGSPARLRKACGCRYQGVAPYRGRG